MMKKVLLLTTVVVLIAGFISAQQKKDIDLTGKTLLDKMNSTNVGDNQWALGYVTGVFCASRKIDLVPDDVTMKKVQDRARKYLAANPKKLSQPANELLKEAWKNEFPLEKK
jgi:hypothetical protein